MDSWIAFLRSLDFLRKKIGLPEQGFRNHSAPAHRTRCVLDQPGLQARCVKNVFARRSIFGDAAAVKEILGAADAIACLEIYQANGTRRFDFESLLLLLMLRFVLWSCAVVRPCTKANRPLERFVLLLLLLLLLLHRELLLGFLLLFGFVLLIVPTTVQQSSPEFLIGKGRQGPLNHQPSVFQAFPGSPILVSNFGAVPPAGLVPGGTKPNQAYCLAAQLEPHDAHSCCSNRRPQPERTITTAAAAVDVAVVLGREGQEEVQHSGGCSCHHQWHGVSFALLLLVSVVSYGVGLFCYTDGND